MMSKPEMLNRTGDRKVKMARWLNRKCVYHSSLNKIAGPLNLSCYETMFPGTGKTLRIVWSTSDKPEIAKSRWRWPCLRKQLRYIYTVFTTSHYVTGWSYACPIYAPKHGFSHCPAIRSLICISGKRTPSLIHNFRLYLMSVINFPLHSRARKRGLIIKSLWNAGLVILHHLVSCPGAEINVSWLSVATSNSFTISGSSVQYSRLQHLISDSENMG